MSHHSQMHCSDDITLEAIFCSSLQPPGGSCDVVTFPQLQEIVARADEFHLGSLTTSTYT